jgi:hypothetical protein
VPADAATPSPVAISGDPLGEKALHDTCDLVGARDQKQMTIIDGEESRMRDETRQHFGICQRYDFVFCAGHDQRRLTQAVQPEDAGLTPQSR